ncbi:hypothetical protein VPH5P1B_0163 [Vibrio phage 5P1b]|nr:hypothetical protein VP277E431_P0164 [Vibrio phage 277E43-1]
MSFQFSPSYIPFSCCLTNIEIPYTDILTQKWVFSNGMTVIALIFHLLQIQQNPLREGFVDTVYYPLKLHTDRT